MKAFSGTLLYKYKNKIEPMLIFELNNLGIREVSQNYMYVHLYIKQKIRKLYFEANTVYNH